MNDQAIFIINPYCHQGKGWKRWLTVKEKVFNEMPLQLSEIVIEKGMNLIEVLPPLMNTTSNNFIISAGGDGSLHYLVNALLTLPTQLLEKVTVGAVGLGSSNDFLKPFGEKINNIPVRINYNGLTVLHDVGAVTYTDEKRNIQKKHFIVNASFGATAEGNWKFNHPGFILKFLKKNMTEAAIIYSALSTIVSHQNRDFKISFNGQQFNYAVSNINVLKVPFVSGSFFYHQDLKTDDGNLSLNICHSMTKKELIAVMRKLEKGQFIASDKKLTAFIKAFEISSAQPFLFECDGETAKAYQVNISIVPNALKTLKN